jgi:hypothetical protein
MNYQEYKQKQTELMELTDSLGNELNQLPKSNGLILDEIKITENYKTLKLNYNKAFKELQDLNTFGMKHFKKEKQAERNLKYQSLTK